MDELKTLRELAEKARALDGEWYSADKLQGAMPDGVATPDAAFMAALSPAVILSLLDEVEKAEAAIQATLQWDADRNYLMPYKVRDPLRAAVAQLDKQEQQ